MISDLLDSVLPEVTLPEGVLDLLGTDGVTALVPTNAAIEALTSWPDIAADETALRRFVLGHVLPGSLDSEAIFAQTELTTLANDVLQVDPDTQTINGAHLVVVNQLGTNGMVHTVDAFLVAPQPAPPATEPPATEPPGTESPPAPEPPTTAVTATPPPGTGG
jgi:uncharacterized surface protein with fasciclin (FAS1) repeats